MSFVISRDGQQQTMTTQMADREDDGAGGVGAALFACRRRSLASERRIQVTDSSNPAPPNLNVASRRNIAIPGNERSF